MKKKLWNKPKLVVLMRGKPEEAVLTLCKVYGEGQGPAVELLHCLRLVGDFCHQEGNT